ncbi:MAG: archease [Acidobacteriota bacterium]|nr:archease [Acidobacteriota bacterium]
MFEILHHTADIRLRVSALSLDELFRDAMLGMYAVMRGEPAGSPQRVTRTIAVEESADTTALLVDFLNEVLQRAHVGSEMFVDARFERLDPESLTLTAHLTGIAPASFEEDVKAVTYHEADVRRDESGWTTMLVFDI